MNCIVIDDDELARKSIAHCIKNIDELTLKGTFDSVSEALPIIKNKTIDLIFLDVEMPEMTGIDFMKSFTEIPQVIIITGKRDYAAEAFDYNVTDYLIKPIIFDRLLKAVSKAKTIHENISTDKEGKSVFIKDGSKRIKINLDDILWVEALGDYVAVNTHSDKFTFLSTMKSIETKFSSDFLRIHRSFIVRFDKIRAIEENNVLIGDKKLPISRGYKKTVTKKIKGI